MTEQESNKKENAPESLIKKYGKRYAFEWFVRYHDENNLRLSKDYTDKKVKKITALAVTNAVITVLLLMAIIWMNL